MTEAAAINPKVRAHWKEYLNLTKPNVVLLMVFTTIVGMLMAYARQYELGNTAFPWVAFTVGNLGIALAAGAAAAVNHYVDRKIDAIMARTKARPLPTGGLSGVQVLAFAFVIGALGLGMLYVWVNPLTCWLTFASLIGYAVVYTMYLKRATPQNIVIGGAAGAAPPVLGWVAVTGVVEPYALLLFLIIFVWTPPHFWALAIRRSEEYAKVDVPMLPVAYGIPFTRLHILLYTLLLLAITALPFVTGMNGWVYFIIAMILGGIFLWYAVRMMLHPDDHKLPMATFWYSIWYLMGMFAALLIDAYIPVFQKVFA